MILRVFAVAGGLIGGAGLAQFPEYAQQYVQRLSGAVDELRGVVADFDRSAQKEGLSRDAALATMTGSDFVERRRSDMKRTIKRSEQLGADLTLVRDASALRRLVAAPRFSDPEIARRALDDFKPAVPLTLEGMGFAGAGFVAGWALIAGLFALIARLLRRRPRLQPALATPTGPAHDPLRDPGWPPSRRAPASDEDPKSNP